MLEPSLFDTLMAEQGPRIFRLCYAWLGDRGRAEDACQEVFLRAWRALGSFRGEAKLSTWLHTIARNVCANIRERDTPPPAASLSDPGTAEAVEHELWRRRPPEARGGPDLLAWLRDLPPNHRAAVTLFYLEQQSYEESAAALGVPVGTFKTWLHRGRQELARRLAAARAGERLQ